MTKNNKKNNKKNDKNLHGFLQVEVDEYKEETGKNAFVAGKPTGAFKNFVDEMGSKTDEIKIEIDETEEMADAIEEVKDIEEAIDELDEEEEEESEPEEKPKKAKKVKKPKKEKVDNKQRIFDYMNKNPDKWYSHRDFTDLDLTGNQTRPKLVKLMDENKVEKKIEKRRNFYKLI